MGTSTRSGASSALLRLRPSFSWGLLCALMACLWLAGGASRADAVGQVVVRSASWLALIAAAALGPVPSLGRYRMVTFLIAAAVLLPLVQLVPVPPSWWQALPGRGVFTDAATLAGQPQPWRPWAIVPGAAANAAGSLVVPAATLVLLAGLDGAERSRLVGLLLALVAAATLVGLLQFSGAGFNNPLINDTLGEVSGTFANRNHFALFVTFGCLLAPVWAVTGDHRSADGRRLGWRGPVALGLILVFALTILASGSRVGMGLGVVALVLGLLLVQRQLRRALKRYPRWAFPVLIAGAVAAVTILVLVSVAADRAVSIERAMTLSAEHDMRSRGRPVVLAMIRAYFPWGSGLGGFDPMFRMHEPFGLLKLTFFNHAHNDWLEVVLDAGLPGLLLLAAAVGWWAVASVAAWRADPAGEHILPKLGSAILLFVMIASAFDYPARTPLMMATMVIAATWLAGAERRASPRFTPD